MKGKKKMYYYMRGWGFAAVVLTVFIIISSSFPAQVAREGLPDAIVEIGKIQAVWKNGFPSLCWVYFYIENIKITIHICGDEVDIRVELKCEMYYEGRCIWPREVDVTLILHLNDLNGELIGGDTKTLGSYQLEGILAVDGEFDSYKNETKNIYCEVIVTPYVVLFDIGPDFHVPWFLKIPWWFKAESSCYIECYIIHQC